MDEIIIIAIVIFLAGIIILTSRFLYLFQVKSSAQKIMRKLQISKSSLIYTLEKLVLFESTQSYNPIISDVKKEHITIKHDYDSFLFQDIRGIKICIETEHDAIFLAYLSVEDFILPTLDLLKHQNKINDKMYHVLKVNQLIQPEIIHDIKTDIYTQIRHTINIHE